VRLCRKFVLAGNPGHWVSVKNISITEVYYAEHVTELGGSRVRRYPEAVETNLTIPALRALRRILRAAELGNRQLATATGLAPSQLLVLQEVGERGEVTPTQLSSALQFSQATITNIVDRLGTAGLVIRQRGDTDKRRVRVMCTEAGRSVIDRAPDLLQLRFSEEFARLPEWEQAMILAGLGRLADILGVASSDAAPLLDAGAIDRPPQL
jgi:DNA-binding MarR family transcriptional regulator